MLEPRKQNKLIEPWRSPVTHQGFKPLAHSKSPLKRTEYQGARILGVAECEDKLVGAISPWLPQNLDGLGTGELPLQENHPDIQQRRILVPLSGFKLLARNLSAGRNVRLTDKGTNAQINSAQSGFTVVEALIAMMIAAVVMIGLSPLVVLSVSARVQARRIDLATQAARSYIDGLRGDAIDPPRKDNANFRGNREDLGVPAPNNLDQPVRNGITCVDKNLTTVGCRNANNPPYLVIQSFRNPPNPPSLTDPNTIKSQGYCVGVRVYRADAFDSGSSPTETKLPPSPLSNTKQYPLAVVRAEIINQTKFNTYKEKFTTNNSPCN